MNGGRASSAIIVKGMNDMKKIFIAFLCICLVISAFVLVGCNDTPNTPHTAFGITYNGNRIELGAKADDIIEKLGTPNSRKEIGDCGGLGAQVKYSYASVDIFVLESKSEGNIIDAIELRDDTLQTDDGVYIGLSEADAKSKMKDAKDVSGAWVLTSGKYSIKVKFANGVVSEIDYITAS